MTELVYDCRNRLIRAGETTYSYDAENNRTGSSDSTGSYEYITDTVSDSLSHVLVITSLDQEGKPVSEKQYIYGNNLILEKHNTFESESASEKQEVRALYHHYNHLGSTVRLTDAQGETIRTYRYGTYGELLSENDGLTCFLYNGSHGVITEKNGLYYMRNRYYSPDIKRFINRDVVTGSMDNSQSLNRYSYVQGNPVSYIDPFGLSPQTVTDGSALVHAVLGFIGLFPVIGIAADVLDCVIYVSEGDYFMATLSMVSAVVDTFGAYKLLTIGDKLSKTAKATKATVQIISGAMNFKVNSARSMEIAADMWQKYHVEGAEKGADYKLDKLALGISLFSSVASALCAVKGAKELNNLSKLDDWTSGFKKWTNSYQGDGGSGSARPNQVHHFASDKSSKYTSQFESITQKYGLELDDAWNKELMPHQGRHPNAYHDWMLEELQTIDKVADGNRDIFLQMFEDVKNTVKENPDMLRKAFWE